MGMVPVSDFCYAKASWRLNTADESEWPGSLVLGNPLIIKKSRRGQMDRIRSLPYSADILVGSACRRASAFVVRRVRGISLTRATLEKVAPSIIIPKNQERQAD